MVPMGSLAVYTSFAGSWTTLNKAGRFEIMADWAVTSEKSVPE